MSRIPEEIIRRVIEATDIVQTISAYYPLKRAGRNFKTNCPFHQEKSPSFVVNPDKQIFHCFGCGAGGNVVSFVTLQEHLNFPEAVRFLAQKVNIEIPDQFTGDNHEHHERQLIFDVNLAAAEFFHKTLLSDKSENAQKARQYLKDRGVELETVKIFQLGFSADKWDDLLDYLRLKNFPLSLIEKAGLIIRRERSEGYYDRFRGRIMFPIFDTQGHCRAFGARAIEKSQEADGAKYINSPETLVYTKGHHMYGFHLAKSVITQDDQVVIVEGYMDCLMPYQAGFHNVVASLGTALTVEQIRLIRRYTHNVVMLYDSDPAGLSAMMRSFDTLIEENIDVSVVTLAEGDDPDSFIRSYGAEALKARITAAQNVFDFKLDYLLKQHDSQTPKGKARIAGEMLPTIYRFPNAVEQDEYLRKLAKKVDISTEILSAEYKKVDTQLSQRISNRIEEKDFVVQVTTRTVERDILRLIIEEKRFIALTKKEIAPSDFHDETIRTVITQIYQLFEQGQSTDIAHLISRFEDPKLRQLISALMTEETPPSADKDKMHADFVGRIKQDRQKVSRHEIVDAIKAAEKSGDYARLEELKIKFNQLLSK
ncbi:MAG: DNA primase [Candidatus Omnitrophica bacterium]|nr:DNA primase [Candidatus Omnitrophota bacterium]